MKKVIVHATVSLDGFMAGTNDEMDWAFEYQPDRLVSNIISEVGACVIGHRTFIIGNMANGQLPYGGLRVPCFVITKKNENDRFNGGVPFKFIDNLKSAVEQAKIVAEDKNIFILGASISQQCIKIGLADEIVIHIIPTLLGKGIRLFDKLYDGRIKLERIDADISSQITSLRFRIIK